MFHVGPDRIKKALAGFEKAAAQLRIGIEESEQIKVDLLTEIDRLNAEVAAHGYQQGRATAALSVLEKLGA